LLVEEWVGWLLLDTNIVIRYASLADVKTLLKIEGECFEYPYDREVFEAMLRSRGCAILLAEVLGNPIGYVAFEKKGCFGTILSIGVAKKFRRRGVGTYLMAQALGMLKEAGVRRVVLQVSVKNLAAQRLYEKLGFRAEGLLRGYYRGEEDAILYSLEYGTLSRQDA
jgi:ribosomal-protein-alanine N-acetyltransferase